MPSWGEVKENGHALWAGRSVGVLLGTSGSHPLTIATAYRQQWDGGLGDGSAQVPPVKREVSLWHSSFHL